MAHARLDIHTFCSTYRLENAESGHHHCHEGWIQLHCPFCAGGSHGFHLGFSLARGSFNCWRCGGHSVWNTVGAFLNTKRSDVISRAIAQCAGRGDVLKRQIEQVRAQKLRPIPGLKKLHPRHIRYLRDVRNFNVKAIEEEWNLSGTRHLSGLWNWRVIAPIFEETGRVVAYVGRSIRKGFKPKYKVTDAAECLINPKALLYGIHKVNHDAVVIVEGPADVWRLGPGAVATLGIDWKRAQANILRKFSRRYIIYDSVVKGDPTEQDLRAKKQAEKLANYLGMFPGVTEIVDGFKTDPGDMSDRQAQKLMHKLLGG